MMAGSLPVSQSSLKQTCTGRPAIAAAVFSDSAPRTTTTGLQSDAIIASAARRKSVFPSNCKSCFGFPRRLEPPAAKMMPPMFGILFSIIDRAASIAKMASIAILNDALYFCDYRNGYSFRCVRPYVQSGRRIELRELFFGKPVAVRR